MEQNKIILYSYFESSCAWRVRNVLNLKRIKYEIRPVALERSLTEGEQHTEEFLKINPMGFVPALYIDGVTLVESLSIMQYLEETRPEIPLMPKDPIMRAKVRAICEIIATGIQPMQNVHCLSNVDSAKEKDWIAFYITKGFKAIEKLLEQTAKSFCVGDEITLADCCLTPQVYNARKYGVDITGFANILRVDGNVLKNGDVMKGHPKNQVREICEIIGSGIQPMQSAHVICNVADEKRQQWKSYYMTKGFAAIEQLLEVSAGRYCVGDEITLADCCLHPQVYNARVYGVDISAFPNVLRVDGNVAKIVAFIEAHPKNQPDYKVA